MRHLVHHRHAPFIEINADLAFDPRKRVFLADRDQHFVAGDAFVGLAGRHQFAPTLGIVLGAHFLESHTGQPAAGVDEGFRHAEIQDWNTLVHRIFLLPCARLHFVEARTHDHLHFFAAEPARGTAAVHRGIAAAKDEYALADLRHVPEINAGEPVEADMNLRRGFLAAGQVQIAATRRAAADEHRVVALGQQILHRFDAAVTDEFDAQIEDVAGFLVDHFLRQAEPRHLGTHEAAWFGIGLKYGHPVAQRGEIAGDGQRRRPGADASDAPAVAAGSRRRHACADVALVVGGDALEPADGDRLGRGGIGPGTVVLLYPPAPAGRFAGAVAGAAEDAGKDVAAPIDHVGIGVASGSDHPNVFGDGRMCGAGPLTIDDFMEGVRVPDIRRLHRDPRWLSNRWRRSSLAIRV